MKHPTRQNSGADVINIMIYICVTVMLRSSPDDEDVKSQFQDLARHLCQQRQFTNVATFTLKCLVCGKCLVGQEDAIGHAQSTGHQNFGQC